MGMAFVQVYRRKKQSIKNFYLYEVQRYIGHKIHGTVFGLALLVIC